MPTLKKITTHARLAAIAIVTLAALVIPALATSGMAYASITNTRVDPAGTLELASSSWLDGAGVDIYSNGNSAANEWGSNYVGSILSGTKWQCVEMVNRLYLTKGWTTGFWTGNGNSLVDHVPSGLTKQNNGAISYLDAGDVITLDDGGFGHAAIINSIGTSIQIVNQNTVAVYSSASIASGAFSSSNASLGMSGWAGYSVQAVVHRPTSTPPIATAAMPISSQLTTGAVQHVFTGTSAGNVIDTSWTGTGAPTSWIVGSSLGAAVTSLSSQYVAGVIHVYATTSSGSVVDIYWGGGQSLGQKQLWSNSSSGNNLTSFVDASGYQHVEVGQSNGYVKDLYWTGVYTGADGGVPNQTPGSGSSLGAAIVSVSTQYPSGVVHVYAATSAGSVVDIYWGGGQTMGQKQLWSNGASGNTLASLLDSGGYQHVEVGTSAGFVRDLYWTGVWTGADGGVPYQTPGSGSSLGAAISSVSVRYPSGVVHVYAATNAGSTAEIYWGGGQTMGQRQVWYRSDTTGNGLSSQVDGSGVQHVYTGITAGSIYDTSWTGIGTPSTTQVK